MKVFFSHPPWVLLVDQPIARGHPGSVLVAAGGAMAIDCTASGKTFAEAVANGKLIAGSPELATELGAILLEMDEAAELRPDQEWVPIKSTHREIIRTLLHTAGLKI